MIMWAQNCFTVELCSIAVHTFLFFARKTWVILVVTTQETKQMLLSCWHVHSLQEAFNSTEAHVSGTRCVQLVLVLQLPHITLPTVYSMEVHIMIVQERGCTRMT